MVELCVKWGISRQCGYKWWRRAQKEGAKCQDRSHRTKAAETLQRRWRGRVLRLKQRYRFAGAAQLRWYLERAHPLGPWPSARTIGRWLQAAGRTRRRRAKPRPGPSVENTPLRVQLANDAWSADFKGQFETAGGQRVCALTVRDVATRYVLLVQHVPRSNERAVGALLRRLFRRYGRPRALWVDNGPPFGGMGPRGWSRLATAWVRLGIEVEYGRPGCPQDNAAHEQMHQVLAAQTTKPPAATLAAQQWRFARWRKRYNEDRPHRAIGMELPCAFYHGCNSSAPPPLWAYPHDALQKRTDPRGRLRWAGQSRMIGRAFARQSVALQAVTTGVVRVYFGPHLLGELHATDSGAIRPVQFQRQPRQRRLPKPGGEAVRLPCLPSA